jgi:uncharacterized protein (DUF1800 family)
MTSRELAIAARSGSDGTPLDVDPQWAWAAYEPDDERPWSRKLAGHLYRRAAFGANWQQLEGAVEAGPQVCVEQLVRPSETASSERSLDDYEAAAARSGGGEALRAWWLRRMLQTPHPLLEKMTLFWHGRFGISLARVNDSQLVFEHVRNLRANALGRYDQLLETVALDPAVYVGLDAAQSRKAIPNENLARQFMERFSVGSDHYGEEDVQEAARAFTGWFVLRGKLRFFEREHDVGTKSVLGRQGNWTGADVVRILLEHPATPRLLVRQLFRFFVSEVTEPTDELLEPLAGALTDDYQVGPVVEKILRSNLFFSAASYRQRIKSPVDFAVGSIRALEGNVPTIPLGADLAKLGQSLYAPPTVKGWVGGRHWINTATLIGREQLAMELLAPEGDYKGKLNPAQLAERYQQATTAKAAEWLVTLLLQDDVHPATQSALNEMIVASQDQPRAAWLREFSARILALPEYQLS